MTETKSTNNGLKVIAGLLAAALIGTLIYTVSLYNNKKETTKKLEKEKNLVVEDLNNLKSDYDRAISESESANAELVEARNKIATYIDSVQQMKADISALSRYRRQVRQLTKEREYLLAQNDSLRASNTLLAMERDSTQVALEEQSSFTDSLVVQNTQLAKVVETGAALSLSKFTAEGVRERNSGKIVSVSNNSRATKLQVCYTVSANNITQPGAKQFYIQIKAPNGNILGENAVAAKEGDEEGEGSTSITYSKASSFYYENTSLDVCDFVEKGAADFPEGRYNVVVYNQNLSEIGSTQFSLR
ncbi:hypothetical protein OOZ15_15630 [Galbibacter sp. EGI 63066]|uniref:hypothetical protein n=1 Tax=Galbibacter sp. EGI 63066 TaxID=2993559 RepID=UPI002248A1C0|nr:hypothetical protein [Galbibacter sp. EGI 63066]MCX2681384.1 hypothetical protein [Galbibacter sp. EGI 63066]